MEMVTAQMQAKRAELDGTDDRLVACSGQIERILTQLESLKNELEMDNPNIRRVSNEAEVERLYSADYTTEMERQVLRAALRGTDLPVAQPSLDGNSVELF